MHSVQCALFLPIYLSLHLFIFEIQIEQSKQQQLHEIDVEFEGTTVGSNKKKIKVLAIEE